MNKLRPCYVGKKAAPAIGSYFEPINPDHPMTLIIEQIREFLNLLLAVDASSHLEV